MASQVAAKVPQKTLENYVDSESGVSDPSQHRSKEKHETAEPDSSNENRLRDKAGNRKAHAYSKPGNGNGIGLDESENQYDQGAVSTDEEDKGKSKEEKEEAKRKKLKETVESQNAQFYDSEMDLDEESTEEIEPWRIEMLENGRRAAVKNIKGSIREIPPEFLGEYQKGYAIVRRFWTHGLTEGHKEKLEKIDASIKRLTKDNYPDEKNTTRYLFPWREIANHTESFQQKYKEFTNSKGEKRKKAAKEIIEGSKMFEVQMSEKGIPFKLLVTKNVTSMFMEVLQSPEAEGVSENMKDMFTKPTPSQLVVLKPAGTLVPKFVKHSQNGEVERADAVLKEIEKLNERLQESNKGDGIVNDDHLLPVANFQRALKVLRTEDEEKDWYKDNVLRYLKKAKAEITIAGLPTEWMPHVTADLPASAREKYLEKLMNVALDIEGEEAPTKELAARSEKSSVKLNNRRRYRSPSTEPMEDVQMLNEQPQQNNRRRHRSPSTEPMEDVQEPKTIKAGKKPLSITQGPASPVSSKFKPKYSAFFGPEVMDGITPYGKIVQIRRAGRGLFRACVNVGTNELPYYFMRPGSDFPKGVMEQLYDRLGNVDELPPETNSWEIMYATCVMTGKAPASGRRAAPQWLTVRTLQEPEKDYVTTISGLGSITGQSQARRMRDEVQKPMEDVKKTLLHYRKLNKHPETGRPLSETDRSKTPWLFSDAPDPWASNGEQRVWSPPILKKIAPEDLSDDEDEDEDTQVPSQTDKVTTNKHDALADLKELLNEGDISKSDIIKLLKTI